MSFATNIWPVVAKSRSLTSSKISRWPARIESWRCQRWCAGSRCRSVKLSATFQIRIRLSPRLDCMAMTRVINEMSSSANILVAGTDPQWRALMCNCLRGEGFVVGEIESENVALESCLQNKLELIVVRFSAGIGPAFFSQLAALAESLGAFVIATVDRAISSEERAKVLALRVD